MGDQPGGQTPDEVNLKDYLKVLTRRRWWVAIVFVAVIIVTALITFTSTPMYKASADIMIHSQLASQGLSTMLSELNLPIGIQNPDLKNQIQLITARATFVRAAALLHNSHSSPTTSLVSAEEIQRAIQVSIGPGSDFIAISATSTAPRQAMELANAVAEAYQQLDRERASATLDSIQQFLGTQMDTVKKALDASQQKLVAFQKQTGLLLQQSLLTTEVSRIEQLLVEARVNLKDDQTKLASINKFLDNIKSEFLTQLTSSDKGTPVLLEFQDKIAFLLKLQKDIAKLENERTQYLNNGNYAQAKLREQEIIDKRKTLEQTAAQQYPIFDLVPKFEDLIKTQLDTKMEIEALKNRVTTLEQMRDTKVTLLLDKGVELARLQGELDITQKVYNILLDEYQKTQIAKAAQLGNVEIINAAQLPKAPFKPQRKMNIIVGIVLGLFSGVGAAFLREFLDNTFHSTEEVEQVLGLLPLGAIPKLRHRDKKWRFQEVKEDLLPNLKTNPVGYQAFLNVATNFRFLSPDNPVKTIVITSALPDEGKSTVAANLALSLGTNNKKVLLIDADFRRPVLERVFQLETNGQGGLSDFILDEASKDKLLQRIDLPESPSIWFLAAGKPVPNPTELLSSDLFSKRLNELRAEFDYIVIDSPPLAVAIDAAILAQKSDGATLVIQAGKTRKETVLKAKKDLERHARKLLGVILNKVSLSSSSYYGGYYYNYYHREPRNVIQKAFHSAIKIRRHWLPGRKKGHNSFHNEQENKR